MFYRNVTGQVVTFPFLGLKSNQDAVTSGAVLTILKDGTSGASAGTLTHVSGGVWKYVFASGETDASMIGLILTATDAMTVVLNLATAEAVELDSATAAKIDAILEDTGTTLPAQISPVATDVQSIASNSSEAF